jgi:transposase InsO family protein
MAEYLIELPHTKEECRKAGSQMKDSALLPKVYWGCASGAHTGWAITEAENESAARRLIDSDILRNKARILQVTKFSKEDIEAYMESTHT